MSYTKIMLAREVLSSDLPDDPDLADRLVRYFPTPLRERYADQIREHRLSREIITTVAGQRLRQQGRASPASTGCRRRPARRWPT